MTTSPVREADVLFYEDVAGRLINPATRQPVKIATITQYLYVRHRHILAEGAARPADIPEPDGYQPPARGGHPRPYWHPATIIPWLTGRQPPGKPRKDRMPRTRREPCPRKTGPRPRAGLPRARPVKPLTGTETTPR